MHAYTSEPPEFQANNKYYCLLNRLKISSKNDQFKVTYIIAHMTILLPMNSDVYQFYTFMYIMYVYNHTKYTGEWSHDTHMQLLLKILLFAEPVIN